MNRLSLIMTILLGLVSIIVTFILYKKSSHNESRTHTLIEKITGLFEASQQMGILTAHENREIALSEQPPNLTSGISFVSRIENDPKLVVIGSSLLGLRLYVSHLTEKLTARKISGFENKFMLTHPCFSLWRESQERRKHLQIEKEIEETVEFLQGCGLDLNQSLQFYKGTPTCFVIITSDAMLINTYPYQTEAYKCFCLEVSRQPQHIAAYIERKKTEIPIPYQIAKNRTEDFKRFIIDDKEREYDYRLNRGPDIFSQFYWYHYVLPWFSPQAVTYKDYCEFCINCTCLKEGTGYSPTSCLIKNSSLLDINEHSTSINIGGLPNIFNK